MHITLMCPPGVGGSVVKKIQIILLLYLVQNDEINKKKKKKKISNFFKKILKVPTRGRGSDEKKIQIFYCFFWFKITQFAKKINNLFFLKFFKILVWYQLWTHPQGQKMKIRPNKKFAPGRIPHRYHECKNKNQNTQNGPESAPQSIT